MSLHQIKIGTRGSKLALIQTELVTDALRAIHPNLTIETVIIKTTGDKNMSPIPLDTVGKEWFTAEIDQALRSGAIDLAVHSLKDLPLDIDPNFKLVTVLERADPRDALISKSGATLGNLGAGSIIGTDSTRRRAQTLGARSDLEVNSLRGNVQTRLRKLHEDDYDAIILAVSGLARLNQLDDITEFLDPSIFVPSSGQGALAATARKDHSDLLELLAQLVDVDTMIATDTERAFSSQIGGGCKTPIGCYATVSDGNVTLKAMVANDAGTKVHYETISGPIKNASDLATELSNRIIANCGFDLQLSK